MYDKFRETLLTPMQLAYVAALEGDGTAAAAVAGFRHPKQAAARLMKNRNVRKSIKEKQKRVLAESARQLGKRLSRADITRGILAGIGRLERTAEQISSRKRVSTSDVVAIARACDSLTKAYVSVAEIEGMLIKFSADASRMFDGKTAEQLEVFALHGYFPGSGSRKVQ